MTSVLRRADLIRDLKKMIFGNMTQTALLLVFIQSIQIKQKLQLIISGKNYNYKRKIRIQDFDSDQSEFTISILANQNPGFRF